MSLKTREIKLFGRDIPGFCWDIPAAPEKFEKKKFVFNSRPVLAGISGKIPGRSPKKIVIAFFGSSFRRGGMSPFKAVSPSSQE